MAVVSPVIIVDRWVAAAARGPPSGCRPGPSGCRPGFASGYCGQVPGGRRPGAVRARPGAARVSPVVTVDRCAVRVPSGCRTGAVRVPSGCRRPGEGRREEGGGRVGGTYGTYGDVRRTGAVRVSSGCRPGAAVRVALQQPTMPMR